MVLAKSKNAVGLGNALMNNRFVISLNQDSHRACSNFGHRFGKGKGADRKKTSAVGGIQRVNHGTGETVSSFASRVSGLR
jgi:large subunit GTPase 1